MISRSGLEDFGVPIMVDEACIRSVPHVVTIRIWYDFFGAILTGPIFSPILLFWGRAFSERRLSYIDAAVYSIAASVWWVIYYYGSFVHDLNKYGPHARDYYVNNASIGPKELFFFLLCIFYIYVIFLFFYRNSVSKYALAALSTGSYVIFSEAVRLSVVAVV